MQETVKENRHTHIKKKKKTAKQYSTPHHTDPLTLFLIICLHTPNPPLGLLNKVPPQPQSRRLGLGRGRALRSQAVRLVTRIDALKPIEHETQLPNSIANLVRVRAPTTSRLNDIPHRMRKRESCVNGRSAKPRGRSDGLCGDTRGGGWEGRWEDEGAFANI